MEDLHILHRERKTVERLLKYFAHALIRQALGVFGGHRKVVLLASGTDNLSKLEQKKKKKAKTKTKRGLSHLAQVPMRKTRS